MSNHPARPPVSVCLASYNGAHYIEAQIHSVLDQLSQQDELIVSDDSSQDQTLALVQQLGDPRIRILQSTIQKGIIQNFENALSHAKHGYIFLCDQDDIWLPGKVDACVRLLQTAVLVVTDCTVVDAHLQPLHASFFTLRGSRAGILTNLWKNSYLGCCMAFRKSILQRALPLPAKLPMHDMWLGLVAQTCGPVIFLPEPLCLYRRHSQANSDAAGKSRATPFQQIGFRIRLLVALVLRLSLKQ
ncbi:MAG: glycosyltransferase family 2 protein [Rhodoferax sp.]|uniref:glycosyltransferase family 2 protein n=1 Tax=Rhodoferax sp. TaxID=50421 RepID=UPI00326772E2